MWRHQQEYNILYLSLLNLHIISPFPVRCLFFFIAANKWRNVNLKSPQLGNVGRRVGAQGAAVILPCDLSDPDLQLLVKAPPCTVRLSLCVCIVSSEGHGFSVQKKPKKTSLHGGSVFRPKVCSSKPPATQTTTAKGFIKFLRFI